MTTSLSARPRRPKVVGVRRPWSRWRRLRIAAFHVACGWFVGIMAYGYGGEPAKPSVWSHVAYVVCLGVGCHYGARALRAGVVERDDGSMDYRTVINTLRRPAMNDIRRAMTAPDESPVLADVVGADGRHLAVHFPTAAYLLSFGLCWSLVTVGAATSSADAHQARAAREVRTTADVVDARVWEGDDASRTDTAVRYVAGDLVWTTWISRAGTHPTTLEVADIVYDRADPGDADFADRAEWEWQAVLARRWLVGGWGGVVIFMNGLALLGLVSVLSLRSNRSTLR